MITKTLQPTGQTVILTPHLFSSLCSLFLIISVNPETQKLFRSAVININVPGLFLLINQDKTKTLMDVVVVFFTEVNKAAQPG